MTPAIACALAAMVCYGLSDLIYKRAAASGLASDYFLMAQAWFFCPVIIAYAMRERSAETQSSPRCGAPLPGSSS